jgi:TRAP-type C4-dicarboxylate transport system substrate-binding protein
MAAILGTAMIIGACAGPASTSPAAPASQGTKAGPMAAPVTLRIGTRDGPDRPAGVQITEFAKRVAAASDGSLRIEPVWAAVDDGPSWDQRVARLVIKDTLDMGLIPTRAWDTEGVTSLRALSAPFLITSESLAAKVVTSDLADQLLAGLDHANVVGLSLFPEGLRHPYGFGDPLLGPATYAGQTIRAPASAMSSAMFAALGAQLTDADIDQAAQAGMESEYAFKPSGIATGNVTFFVKINSLVISKAAFDRLTDQQRDTLRQAADQTQAWVIENAYADAERAAEFCQGGSSIVAATDAEIAELEAAVAPVYAELEQDTATKGALDAIRAIKATVGPVSAPTCDGSVPVPSQAAEATPIDGVYRATFTLADLQRSPFLMDTGELNDENWGAFILKIDRGRIDLALKNDTVDRTWTGTFSVLGDKVRFELPTYAPGVHFGFRWALEGSTLTFRRDLDVGEGPTSFLVKPWTKDG